MKEDIKINKLDIIKDYNLSYLNNPYFSKTAQALLNGVNKKELLSIIHDLCVVCNTHSNILMKLARYGITDNEGITGKNPIGTASEQINKDDMVYWKDGAIFKRRPQDSVQCGNKCCAYCEESSHGCKHMCYQADICEEMIDSTCPNRVLERMDDNK